MRKNKTKLTMNEKIEQFSSLEKEKNDAVQFLKKYLLFIAYESGYEKAKIELDWIADDLLNEFIDFKDY